MTKRSSASQTPLDKAALRDLALRARKLAFSVNGAAASEAIAERALAFLRREGGLAKTVAAYISIRDELDTASLIDVLSENGFAIALPVIRPGPNLLFRLWTRGSPLTERRFGLREPGDACAEVSPDVVFVPLLAFDAVGNRLGYGAGYYDAGLSALRARGPTTAVGLAFDEQEMARIPHESHDQRLDAIITPSRTILCGA